LSSSRSISSSPKVRVWEWPQKSPIPLCPVEVWEAEDVEELGASRRREGLVAPAESLLQLLEGHVVRLDGPADD
jgi:hypothetical protein